MIKLKLFSLWLLFLIGCTNDSEYDETSSTPNRVDTLFYDNGRIELIASYNSHDQLDGEAVKFYANGNLKMCWNFRQGLEDGWVIRFDSLENFLWAKEYVLVGNESLLNRRFERASNSDGLNCCYFEAELFHAQNKEDTLSISVDFKKSIFDSIRLLVGDYSPKFEPMSDRIDTIYGTGLLSRFKIVNRYRTDKFNIVLHNYERCEDTLEHYCFTPFFFTLSQENRVSKFDMDLVKEVKNKWGNLNK